MTTITLSPYFFFFFSFIRGQELQPGLLISLVLQSSTEYMTGFLGESGWDGNRLWEYCRGYFLWWFSALSVTWESKWEVSHLQIFPQIDIYGMEAENIKAGNICQPGGRKWWWLGALRMLPPCGDLAAGLGRPPTYWATWLRSFCPKLCQSVLASSRALRRGQGLILSTANAKMAGLRLLQILKLCWLQSLPSHSHSPVAFAQACNPGTKHAQPASALAILGST